MAEVLNGDFFLNQKKTFVFTANGNEYFKIWIVNLFLTIITLGIYGPWAKVRRLQYFYANTALDGSVFQYHGQPLPILKGRVVLLALCAVVYLLTQVGSLGYLPALMIVGLILPWLIQGSMRFKARNASWRGVHFSFSGDLRTAYGIFYFWFPLAAVTYIFWPSYWFVFKKWQINNSAFGNTKFSFLATSASFWMLSIKMIFGLFVLGILLLFIDRDILAEVQGWFQSALAELANILKLGDIVALLVFTEYLVSLVFIFPFFLAMRQAMFQNLIWNNTRLGPHIFRSNLNIPSLGWVHASNALAIVCTLGLFTPWARVRAARERLEALSLIVDGSIDRFLAGVQNSGQRTAVLEEVSEGAGLFFDIDLSL